MIKPETLWNLFKSTKIARATWLGEICIAIGMRDSSFLADDQCIIYDMVVRDSEWTDERCQKERARKKEAYERKRRFLHGENGKDGFSMEKTEKTDSPPSQAKPSQAKPSQAKPSQHNIINNIVRVQDAATPHPHTLNFHPPKWGQVVNFITGKDCLLPAGRKIPEAIARDWFDYRSVGEWRTNSGAPIRNWRTDLLSNAERQRRINGDEDADIVKSDAPTAESDKIAKELNKKRIEEILEEE